MFSLNFCIITQNQTPENPNAIGICYHSVITLQNHHCHICYITLKSSFDKIFIIHCISLKFHCQIIRPSAAAAAAKSLQSCPTLCDPIDGSPPGSPIPEILPLGTSKLLPEAIRLVQAPNLAPWVFNRGWLNALEVVMSITLKDTHAHTHIDI